MLVEKQLSKWAPRAELRWSGLGTDTSSHLADPEHHSFCGDFNHLF